MNVAKNPIKIGGQVHGVCTTTFGQNPITVNRYPINTAATGAKINPPGVARAFEVLVPTVLVLVVMATIGWISSTFLGLPLNDLIYVFNDHW